MPYPNEHAVRLHEPNFSEYRRTNGGTIYGKQVPNSVSIIWGKDGDTLIPQALRFLITSWTFQEVKKWVSDNDIKYISMEPAKNTNDMFRIENKKNIIDIFINGVIEDEGSLELANIIKNIDETIITNLIIHINSYGGSVKGAWDIVSAIKNKEKLHTTCINEGFAISAASIILACGDTSKAYDYSMAMIHDPLLGKTTLEESEGKDRELLQAIKDGIVSVYKKRFRKDIDVSSMMTKETSMNATEQLNTGLVDEIIEKHNKPLIPKDLEIIEIYNIITEHNNKEFDIEPEKNELNMKELINYLSLDETATEEQILAAVKSFESGKAEELETVKNEFNEKVTNLTNELNGLKVQNFILTNDLNDKTETINAAVEKHGIAVLDTILEFVSKETKNLQKEINNIVNDINEELNDINDKPLTNEDKIKLADKLFAIDGDQDEQESLKESNPELHEELFNLYYGIE